MNHLRNLALVVLVFVLPFVNAVAGETLWMKHAAVKPAILMTQMKALSVGINAEAQASHYQVVQFKTTATNQDQQALRALGFEMKTYLPDDAYVIHGNLEKLVEVMALPSVSAVVPYMADWKLSSEITPNSVFTQDMQLKVLVRTFGAKETLSILSQFKKSSGEIPDVQVESASKKLMVLSLSRQALEKVAALDGVEYIEPVPELQTFDFQLSSGQTIISATGDYTDLTGFETGTHVMNLDVAWSRGYNGAGQIASMSDTGLDVGDVATIHKDFTGQITSGYAFGMFATKWNDPQGHGTHVAGSIVGTGAASGGKLRGGAWGAKFIAEGMWSPMMNNITPPPKIQSLFEKAYADGARVHSNSWGNPKSLGGYDALSAQVDEYMWNNPDMLILFAAGNSGLDANKDGHIDEGSVSSPGTAKNVLTVGASENYLAVGGIQKKLSELRGGADNWGVEPLASDKLSDNPNGVAAFSSRGPTLDGRIKPEIVAPGTNIVSVHSQDPKAGALWGLYNNDYAYAGGTSMATPLTAGAATVTRQYLVHNGLTNPSAAMLKAVLAHTAVDLFPGQFGVGPQQELPKPRPNVHEGYGRVDMAAVTELAQKASILDDVVGVAQDEEKVVFTGQVSGSFRVTMAYTDAPASASAAKALVNNLDLIVTDSSGKRYALQDTTNNMEMLELKNLPAGQVRVSVKGTRIAVGKNNRQPFALVISK